MIRESLSMAANETRRKKDADAAQLAVAYLPKGNLEVVHRDMLGAPVRFLSRERRDRHLRIFYCGDKKLLKKARRAARKLGLV